MVSVFELERQIATSNDLLTDDTGNKKDCTVFQHYLLKYSSLAQIYANTIHPKKRKKILKTSTFQWMLIFIFMIYVKEKKSIFDQIDVTLYSVR